MQSLIKSSAIYVAPWPVWVQSVSFLFLFAGFLPTQTYLAAVYGDVGRGNLSLLYAVYGVATLFSSGLSAPLGARLTLFLSSIMYVVFGAAASSGSVPFLWIGSVVIGLAAATLWTSASAAIAVVSTPETLGRNNGLFFAFVRLSTAVNLVVGFLVDAGVSIMEAFFLLCMLTLVGSIGLLGLWLQEAIVARRRGGLAPPAVSLASADGNLAHVHGYSAEAESPVRLAEPAKQPTFWAGVVTGVKTTFRMMVFNKDMRVLIPLCIFGMGAMEGFAFGVLNIVVQDALGDAAIGKIFATAGVVGILAALIAGWVFDATKPVRRHWLLVASVVLSITGIAIVLVVLAGVSDFMALGLLYGATFFIFSGIGTAETFLVAILNGLFKDDELLAAFAVRLLLDSAGTSLTTGLASFLSPAVLCFVWLALLAFAGAMCMVGRQRIGAVVMLHPSKQAVEMVQAGPAATSAV